MTNVHSGQRVITTAGTVRTVAIVTKDGIVFAYSPNGWLEEVVPLSDAWGGEVDLNVELVAA